MTEPRKVWVCFTERQAEQVAMDIAHLPTPIASLVGTYNSIRAALARKPDEEPWEGWEDCTREVTPEMGINTRHVLVIPLPEEKP